MFSDDGPLSIYKVLGPVDNCLFSGNTIWTGNLEHARDFRHPWLRYVGRQYILEATQLDGIEAGRYECVLSSHCLEHVANPFRALSEWRRVLSENGLLLMVLPHNEGTFDQHRPVTPLSHLIADYENNTGEDDLTHLPEIFSYHDLARDRAVTSLDAFRRRCHENFIHRAIHHHVFDTATVVAMLNHARFQLIRVDTHKPCHIIVLAQKTSSTPDNSAFTRQDAACYSQSCFLSDHPSD